MAYVDVRVYFCDDAGAWHPTKKGVTLSPALWEEFTAVVAKGDAAIEASPAKAGKR